MISVAPASTAVPTRRLPRGLEAAAAAVLVLGVIGGVALVSEAVSAAAH